MKKLLMIFVLIFGVGNCWGWSNSSTDEITGARKSYCNRNRNPGEQIFCATITNGIRTCRNRSGPQGYKWDDCRQIMCDGYDYANYDSATMDSEPVDNGSNNKCWAWKCKSGYAKNSANICINSTECVSMGGEVSNGNCIPSTWCTPQMGKEFNPNIHQGVKNGTCSSYQCKPGFCGETTISPTCAAVKSGVFGGMYRGADGVCQKCEPNQYVSANKSGCTDGLSANKSNMKRCFNCLETDKFADCIRNGGSLTSAGCPTDSVSLQDDATE